MAKRRPDQQLTQNNWDEELEKDEVGQFQKADDTEMKQRVIRVAKRRIRGDEPDGNGSGAKAVFSGFSLVSNKSAIEATPSKPMFSFGSSFSSQPSVSNAPFGASSGTTPSFGNQPKIDDNKSSEFVTELKKLNDAFLSCIKGHVESGKACILTPITKDYDKYIVELEEKYKNPTAVASSPAKTNHANSTASTATAATPSFSFSYNAAKPIADSSSTNTAATTAAVVASSIVAAPTQSTSAAPMFSFGKSTASTFGSGSSGFSFSSAIQAPKPVDGDKKTDTNGNKENAEDEDDEPPKVEYKPVVEDESFYSKRCKVFVKDDGDYKDRGTGTLYLKNVKDDKVQLIVRADTNLGNILLNILLSSASPAKQLKNNVVLVCIPTPESEPKPKSVLIRVKTADDATDLLKEIEKHQK